MGSISISIASLRSSSHHRSQRRPGLILLCWNGTMIHIRFGVMINRSISRSTDHEPRQNTRPGLSIAILRPQINKRTPKNGILVHISNDSRRTSRMDCSYHITSFPSAIKPTAPGPCIIFTSFFYDSIRAGRQDLHPSMFIGTLRMRGRATSTSSSHPD